MRGVAPVIVLRRTGGLCLVVDVPAGLALDGGAGVFGRRGCWSVDGARDRRVRSPKRLLYSSSLYSFRAASRSAFS